jgi:ankyrin repeat protein
VSKARILEAVRHLDVEGTMALLDRQPSLLSVTDRSGRNLLHVACSVSCQDLGVSEAVSARLVNLLLDRGLDVDSPLLTSGYPCNSVWFAVAKGRNVTLVELLVKRGARPCGLFAAGWHEDLKLMQLLIDLGAIVDERVEDETPFLHCWRNRRLRAARVLLHGGADVNARDAKGKTALHYAVKKGFEPSTLRALVRSGASPDIEDRDGVSPRRLASRKRDKRFLRALG